MAAAVPGVVRASLDADAVVAVQVREAQALRQSLYEEGYEAALRSGDVEHPIPPLLEVKDRHRTHQVGRATAPADHVATAGYTVGSPQGQGTGPGVVRLQVQAPVAEEPRGRIEPCSS